MEILGIIFGVYILAFGGAQLYDKHVVQKSEEKRICTQYLTNPTKEQISNKGYRDYYDKLCRK